MSTRHLTSCLAIACASALWVNCALASVEDDGDSNTSEEPSSKSEDGDDKEATSEFASQDKNTKPSDEQERDLSHTGQFSLRFGVVAAERIISRYDESPSCGIDDEGKAKKFCGFGAPVALDLAIGFAPFKSLEPFAWARFGLSGESVTHTKPLVILGVGARLYTMSESAFKFFIQPAVGWELESNTGSVPFDGKQYKKDFLIQILAGPQYDFAKNVGAYVGFGVTAGMLRAIQTWMELDIGVQARF